MNEVIVKMTEGRLGLALLGDSKKLDGIITDGDLRRSLVKNIDLNKIKPNEIMNSAPLIANEFDNLQVAHERMKRSWVQCLVVKNDLGLVVGVIQIFK